MIKWLYKLIGWGNRVSKNKVDTYDTSFERDGENQKENVAEKKYDGENVVIGGASVTFMVDIAGNVHIQLDWTDESEEVSEALGTLLYFINSGRLALQCEYILLELMKQDASLRLFYKSVAKHWRDTIKVAEQVVKPSEVFQIGKQRIKVQGHSNGRPE